jgi:hypothetical protein
MCEGCKYLIGRLCRCYNCAGNIPQKYNKRSGQNDSIINNAGRSFNTGDTKLG